MTIGELMTTTTQTPLIARSLFDPITHEAIKKFLAERLPLNALGSPVDTDEAWEDDLQKFNRKWAHNVPYLVNIHRQLTPWACEQFGEKVKPSYAFLSMYNDKGICPLHVDRPQCYRTIDYLIDCDVDELWPIYIGEPMTDEQRSVVDKTTGGHPHTEELIAQRKEQENFTEVVLSPNDAVLYSGTHQWHYRDRIKGRSASLAFFHFVPEDFDGPLA